MSDFDPWKEYEQSINKEAGFKSIADCDHFDDNTKSWCQEVGVPTEIGDYSTGWGVSGMMHNGPYDAAAYCPKHAPLHCIDDWEKDKEGCGGINIGRYNQCIDCEGSNKQYAKDNKIIDEEITKEYRDAFGFGKEAINYFSLDQPNQAIMPGMAQEDPADDGLGFGSVGNPDSGMEDNVTQDFPGMHDYERGLSSAASKTSSFEKIIFCDECGKPNPNFDEYTPKNWGRASLNGFDLPLRDAIHNNPRTAELGEYNDNNELHYCPDCKNNRHLDTNISDPFKMTFGCGEPIGRYGQCEQCDQTNEDVIKNYKDAFGFDKDSSKKIASLLVGCDDCGTTEEVPYTGYNFKDFMDKGWDGTGDDQGPHFCPKCMKKRCSVCWVPAKNSICEDCSDDPWVQVKQATTYVHCDNCDNAIPAEYIKPRSHIGWYGLGNLRLGPHYCDNCMKDRCHECGETLGSYGQCPQCKGTDEDIEKDYEDAWEFNKNASYLRYGPNGEEEDLQCDHQGCNEFTQAQGYDEDLPDGWPVGGLGGDVNFCPQHSNKHCVHVYLYDKDKEYYGCGELLRGTHCPNSVTDKDCFENEQYRLSKKKKRDQDAWKFDKKASLDDPWKSPILVLADRKTVRFTITTCDDCGKRVTEKHKSPHSNYYDSHLEKTKNWEIWNTGNDKIKCPDCALKSNQGYFGLSGTNENSMGWKPTKVAGDNDYVFDDHIENMTIPQFKNFEKSPSAHEDMLIVSPDDTETKHITSRFKSNKHNPEKAKLITTIHGYTPSLGNINATKRDIVSHLKTLAPNSKNSVFSTPVSKLRKKDLKSLYIGDDLTNGLDSGGNSVYTNWERQIPPISYFYQHMNKNYATGYDQKHSKRTKYKTESIQALDLDKNGHHKWGDSWSIRLIHKINPGNFEEQLKEANDKHQAIRKLISSNPDATFQDKLINSVIDYRNAWGFDDDNDNKTVTAGLTYHKVRVISCDGCGKEIEDKQSPYGSGYKRIDKSAPGWERSYWSQFICPDCKKNENPRYMDKSKNFKDLGWEAMGFWGNDVYKKETLDSTKTKSIKSRFQPNPYNGKPEITTIITGFSEGNITKHKKNIISHLKSLYPNSDHPIFNTAPSNIRKFDFEEGLDLNDKPGKETHATWWSRRGDYRLYQKYYMSMDNNKNLYGYTDDSMSKIGPGSSFHITKTTSMPASNRLEKHIKAADAIHQGIVDAISSNPDCTYQDRLKNNVDKYTEAWGFDA